MCHQKNNYVIRWEYLQVEIQREYGKFRLRYDLRNIWNRRRLVLQQSFLSTLYETDEEH
jgi:hypothetical protein